MLALVLKVTAAVGAGSYVIYWLARLGLLGLAMDVLELIIDILAGIAGIMSDLD